MESNNENQQLEFTMIRDNSYDISTYLMKFKPGFPYNLLRTTVICNAIESCLHQACSDDLRHQGQTLVFVWVMLAVRPNLAIKYTLLTPQYGQYLTHAKTISPGQPWTAVSVSLGLTNMA